MKLLLVHGMGRTAWSMRRLGRELERSGHAVELFAYFTYLESAERIVGRLRDRLSSLAGSGGYAVVGHSLGGLLLRLALNSFPLPAWPARLVMLGTPNQLPRLARSWQHFWPYRLINGECGQLLARGDLFSGLQPPPAPYTIIAGTGGWQGRLSPFEGEQNDGLVAVGETLIVPEDRPVTLPVRHTFMMNDRRVREVIRAALDQENSGIVPDAGDSEAV